METSIEKYDRKDIPAGGVPGAEKNGVPAVGKQDFVKKEDESREAFATRVRDTLQERFTIMLQEVFLNQLDKDLDKESKEEHEEFVPYDGFAGGLIIHMHSVIDAYMRMHTAVLAHQYQKVVGQLERISSEVLFEEGAVEVDVLSKMDEWTLVKFTRVQLKWWLLAHARCIALESMLHQSESLSQSTKEEVDRAIMQRVKNMEMLPVCDQDDLLGCQSPFALKVVDLVASMTLTRAGQQAQAGDTLGKGTLRAEIHKARKLTNKSTVLQFGDTSIASEMVFAFEGNGAAYPPGPAPGPAPAPPAPAKCPSMCKMLPGAMHCKMGECSGCPDCAAAAAPSASHAMSLPSADATLASAFHRFLASPRV